MIRAKCLALALASIPFVRGAAAAASPAQAGPGYDIEMSHMIPNLFTVTGAKARQGWPRRRRLWPLRTYIPQTVV